MSGVTHDRLHTSRTRRAAHAFLFVSFAYASFVHCAYAAKDTQDGPPPCGADNVCNLAVCSSDPDCPADLPDGAGSSENPPPSSNPDGVALDDVIDCDSVQEKDIRAVAWNIADDWSNFERAVESASGSDLGSCIKNRFSKNGKVQCVAKEKCNDNGKCKLGFGSGAGQKIKIFQTFFDNVAALSQPDRRACYAALMTHEFSHTCEHYGENQPESRAEAAFNYWKDRFAPSSSVDLAEDCGMND